MVVVLWPGRGGTTLGPREAGCGSLTTKSPLFFDSHHHEIFSHNLNTTTSIHEDDGIYICI
jgi:hypothetical protein